MNAYNADNADNGLICAPAEQHARVLETIQRVLSSYGEIPWSK